MAIEHNIGVDDHWFTGEDKRLPFTIYQSDGVTRQDITGWTLSYMVKRKKTDAAALLEKTTADDITLTNAAQGEGYVQADEADTAPILGGRLHWHEIKRTDPGLQTVLMYGTLMRPQAVHP